MRRWWPLYPDAADFRVGLRLVVVGQPDDFAKAPDPTRFDPLPGPALGTVFDGYWRLQQIAPGTYAIGKPQDAPDNYEFLLIGQRRALTTLPVTVLPTHLHWDHIDRIGFFTSISLIDQPETRACDHGGFVQLTLHGFVNNYSPRFKVTEWVKPDGWIDLGGRRVQVLSTPGHTATSVKFWSRIPTCVLAVSVAMMWFLNVKKISLCLTYNPRMV